MDSDTTLRIAYSGTLNGFDPSVAQKKQHWTNWFWTYRNDQVDATTRSGYYFIKAIQLLAEKYNVSPDAIQADWWGAIDPLNKEQIAKAGLEKYFTIDGYITKEASLQRLSQASLLFLPLERAKQKGRRTLFIPGKLYEYLKTGKPVLALCEPSDCRDILERSGLGIFADPASPEDIAAKLYALINDPALVKNCRPDINYINSFSFREKTRELAEVFNKLM